MATYHPGTDTVSNDTGAVHNVTRDNQTHSHKQAPGRAYNVQHSTDAVMVGGVALSPAQAQQYGFLPKIEGQKPEQVVRSIQMNGEIQQHANVVHGLNPDGTVPQQHHAPRTPQQALGQALGIGNQAPLTAEQNATLAAENQRRALMGKPELSEAEYVERAKALNASKRALEGDPDSAEVVPNHYRAENIDPSTKVVQQFNEYFSDVEKNTLLDIAIDGREVSSEKLRSLVLDHGLREPSQLMENINKAMDIHGEAFNRYANDRGVDAEDFKAWARENRPEVVNKLAREQFLKGDPRVWSGLINEYGAQQFLAHPEHAVHELRANGIEAEVIGKEVIVKVEGIRMPLSEAFKRGLLKATPK